MLILLAYKALHAAVLQIATCPGSCSLDPCLSSSAIIEVSPLYEHGPKLFKNIQNLAVVPEFL